MDNAAVTTQHVWSVFLLSWGVAFAFSLWTEVSLCAPLCWVSQQHHPEASWCKLLSPFLEPAAGPSPIIRQLLPNVINTTHNLVTQHSLQGCSKFHNSTRSCSSATKVANDSLGLWNWLWNLNLWTDLMALAYNAPLATSLTHCNCIPWLPRWS